MQDAAHGIPFMDMIFFKRCLLASTFFILSFVISPQLAVAGGDDLSQGFSVATRGQWLFGAGVGGVARSLRTSTRVNNGTPVPAPFNQDIYTIPDLSNEAIFNIFAGYQWHSLNRWFPYYGLSLHYERQFSTKIKGTVQQYGLPLFSNYKYSLQLNSSIVYLVGKVNLIQYQSFLPYFSAGFGVAFNRVNDYAERPIPLVSPPRVSPGYTSETNINFAYTLGVGIDYIFCENVWLAVGYEYLNLGQVNSGQGSGSWSGTRLNFGTLHTNTLFGTITYLF